MTREGKPLRTVLAIALAATLLAGCGGSGSGSSSTATTSAPSAAAAESGQHGSHSQSQAGTQHPSKGSRNHQPQRQGAAQDGSSASKNVATPLKVSGGGSSQFIVKGGDNSIQEYGDEGSESELQEAAEIVHGFLVAQAEEKWATACSYLSKRNIESLEKLGAQSQSNEVDCSSVLKAFTSSPPASIEREITTVDAGSFRHEGSQGFLLYYGAGHKTYSMPMVAEGGTWKVTALSGTVLS